MSVELVLQLLLQNIPVKKKKQKKQLPPVFVAEPMRASNSFVGTEEYIAPVRFCIESVFEFSKKKMLALRLFECKE